MEVTLSKEEVSGDPQYWRCLKGKGLGLNSKREGAGARVQPTLQIHVLWVSKAPFVCLPCLAPGEQEEARQAQLREEAFTNLM